MDVYFKSISGLDLEHDRRKAKRGHEERLMASFFDSKRS
jgi:hypothetical protein